MRNHAVVGWLVAAVALGVAPRAVGQAVHGRVVDDSTGAPLVATLTVLAFPGPAAATVQSTPDGSFRIAVQPGEYRLRVQRVGYREWLSETFVLQAGAEVELAPRLAPTAVELEPAEVVGQPASRRSLREFELRREHQKGRFITRAEFEKSNPRQVTDVLLRMPGLRLVPNPCYMKEPTGPCRNSRVGGADTRRYILRPRGGPITFGNANRDAPGEECGVLVYLDGRYVGDGLRIDLDLVPVDQVEAIEVYTGASQIPTELNRTGSACGVIVIWSR